MIRYKLALFTVGILLIGCSLDPIPAPEVQETPDIVADFSYNPQECGAPCVVNFTDLSENATQWTWNFGDENSGDQNESNLQNPTHSYNQPGEYMVTLEASSTTKKNQVTKTVTIEIPNFFKTFGSMGSETANSIIQTSDNFYVVVGKTNSTAYTNDQMNDYLFLWKFDELGGSIFQDPVVLKANSNGHSLIENSSGLYVVIGEEFNADGSNDLITPLFATFQSNGSLVTLKDINNPIDDNVDYMSLNDILEIGEQYAITGYEDLCRPPTCPHMLLAYLDPSGNIINGSIIHVSSGISAKGNSISKTTSKVLCLGQQDGNFLLAENILNNNSPLSNTLMLPGNQEGVDILGTSDNKFIIIGTTDAGQNGGIDIVFTVVDNNLEQTMDPKHFGGSQTDKPAAIVAFEDDFLIAGSSNSGTEDGSFDVILIKVDIEGNILWQEVQSVEGSDEFAKDVKATSDGGLIITGYMELLNNTRDVFLLKTTNRGLVL